jgi:CRISPR/Cas system-associated endoribonuclease Cas2
MALYIITYDERAKHRDYKPLYDQLNAWRAAHLQNSVWLVDLTSNTSQIRDTLLKHMHPDDTVCVIQMFPNSNWAAINARPAGVDWLKSHAP